MNRVPSFDDDQFDFQSFDGTFDLLEEELAELLGAANRILDLTTPALEPTNAPQPTRIPA